MFAIIQVNALDYDCVCAILLLYSQETSTIPVAVVVVVIVLGLLVFIIRRRDFSCDKTISIRQDGGFVICHLCCIDGYRISAICWIAFRISQ